MMVKIKKQLVSSRKNTYDGTNGRKYITIHETDNTNKGANAQAHANLQSRGNSRSASWHWTVDDKEAIQSFPHTVRCWAAGDGKGDGNYNSINIEICVNSDGDFNKAVENAAELTRMIMEQENIPLSNVVQHNHWSGKNCPRNLRSGSKGITWNDFLNMVVGKKVDTPKKEVKPAQTKNKANLIVDGKWGSETTKALQKALGTVVDGVISSQPRNHVTEAIYGGITWGTKGSMMVRALQKKVGAKVDGKLGPETVRKLQRYLGTPVDGKISRPTSLVVKELQRRLNEGTF